MLFRHILGGAYAMGSPTQPSAPGLRAGVAAGRFELMPTLRQLCMLALNVNLSRLNPLKVESEEKDRKVINQSQQRVGRFQGKGADMS